MTGWFLSNMVWASAAMLLVLLIRRPFAALFGAGPVYALWLLPALRLVAPPLPAWGVVDLPTLIPPTTIIMVAEDMAAPMPPDGGPGQWVPMLLAIWAVGAAAFLFRQFRAHSRFLGALRRDSRPLGTHHGVRIEESGAVEGPLSFGLLRRRIVVPRDFECRYSPAQRVLALDHEAVHHRRLDLWWNHLGLVILALNWFNPIAWAAFRAFRADQELACDAAVAAKADRQARLEYACALVKSASRPGLIAACPLNHADQLKRRLKMMKFHRPGRLRLLGGAAAIAALGGLGLALSSPGAVAQQGAAPKAPPSAATVERGGEGRTRVIVHNVRREAQGPRGERSGSDAPDRREERRVTVVTRSGDGAEARTVEIEGPGGHRIDVPRECENAEGRTEVNEGDETNRTRIILCARGTQTPVQRLEGLERARERLGRDSHLSAEHRERVLAALDQEIARLRALR